MPRLDELPWQYLLLFTSPHSLGILSQVSKLWNSILKDDVLWSEMDQSFFLYSFHDTNAISGRGSLIRHCVAWNQTNPNNERLLFSVKSGYFRMVQQLLSEKKADVDYKGKEGITSIYMASKVGDLQMVKVLLDYNAKTEDMGSSSEYPLHVAARGNWTSVVLELSRRGSDVNSRDRFLRTVLHKAAYEFRLPVIACLTSIPQTDIHIKEPNYQQTALHIASSRNFIEGVELLLKAKANPNAIDRDGWTPLHIACEKGNMEVVVKLLNYGADKSIECGMLGPAERFAARRNHPDIVTLLRQHH